MSPWKRWMMGTATWLTEILPAVGTASSVSAVDAALPKLMTEHLETALAMSAAPQHVGDGATIYLLRRGGYVLHRRGSNHFTCFVVRTVARFDVQSPDTLIPICFDEEGTRTIAPIHFDTARYREQGMSMAEIRTMISEGFENGGYAPPARTGISYMISPVLNLPDGKGGVWNYPPHFMIYASHVTNEEVDATPDRGEGWLPWINNVGPHGMIIVPVGQTERERIRSDHRDLLQEVDKFLQTQN